MSSLSSGKGDRQRGTVTDDLVTAIAEAENADELTLSPPLYDVINVDALTQLIQSGDKTVQVSFDYRQCEVEIRGNGAVNVTKPPDEECEE